MHRRPAKIAAAIVLAGSLTLFGQHRRGGTGAAASAPQPLKGVVISFHGTLQDLSKKSILLASDENQLVTIRRSSKTKFLSPDHEIKADEVAAGDKVTIDATEDNDLKFLALSVRLDAVQPPEKPRTLVTR